ncbi:MAG: hypothetical protein ACOY5Y_05795 [Pseudomonadota bacterium]|jgi:hypothetical protein
MTTTRFLPALALLAVGVAAPAAAQPKPPERAAIVQGLVDCRKLTDDAQRLACYDQAAAALDQAEAKGDVVIVDREQARQVRRQAFGFSMPSISLFERGETQEAIENVAATVRAARQNGAGKWVVELDDGAVWVQVDANELHRDPRAGMPVKIRQAAMGSYLMSIGGQRGFRARRVE